MLAEAGLSKATRLFYAATLSAPAYDTMKAFATRMIKHVADRELRGFTWNAPLYAKALRDEHEALMASAEREDPGNLWIRADCSKEIRVPAQHPLAKRVAKDRELYDAERDGTDRGNLWARDEATRWAYKLALLALDGVRAQGYWTRHSRAFMPGEFITPTPEASVSLLLT